MIRAIIRKIKKARHSPIEWARILGVSVGDRCKFIGHPDFGSEPWLVAIGDHVELSSGVRFITHDGATWVFRDDPQFSDVIRYGKIVINDNCFIGTETMILPGVEIGENCIIGARSLVTKSVPSGSVYAGVPAKCIGTVEEYKSKVLAGCHEYDKELYKTDKKTAVLQMLEGRLK